MLYFWLVVDVTALSSDSFVMHRQKGQIFSGDVEFANASVLLTKFNVNYPAIPIHPIRVNVIKTFALFIVICAGIVPICETEVNHFTKKRLEL